eukprot:CAMPEP_0198295436 /NCGR_PEP_ID=MMETSP1449-20131203/27644_1 /TAXON_ID=420275 /ORGANISM="Attheya septentrionalis, Strain CCMP2084" /LENGTH=543 /DNA_ID=CAMNT_0043995741 /DNA_START=196 /DNA_END=1824 /DNA_ORIENTATION=-
MMMMNQEKEDRGRLLLAWVHNEIRNGTVSNELWKQCRECPELLMRGNSIGWTALHFATSHHAPQQQQQANRIGIGIGIPSPQITPPWMWMFSILQQQQQHDSNYNNPWEARNEVGQSPVDLFFLTHLHPLPWQRPEVHRAARRLRACFSRIIIRMIAPQQQQQQHYNYTNKDRNTNALIGTTIRRRFNMMLRQTQQEQPPYDNDDDKSRWTTPRTTATTTTTTTTTIHAEYYDWEESSEDDNDSDSGEAQEEMDLRRLVEFWHPMEVMLRAATASTIPKPRNRVPQKANNNDNDDNDNEEKDTFRVVHALARTNCPPCVAQLAVLLHPSQPREWQRQRQPNYEEDAHPPQQQLVHLQQLLPLHICLTSPNAFDDWATTPMRNTNTNTNANHDTNHATTTNATVNVTSGATHSMRRVLLDVYPEGAAASIPCDPNTTIMTTTTKSPLVALELALEVGRVEDWGTGYCEDDDDNDDRNENGGLLEELLHVYPEVLHTWSGIPPFVRAALARVSPEAATVHAKTHPIMDRSNRSRSNINIRTTSMW